MEKVLDRIEKNCEKTIGHALECASDEEHEAEAGHREEDHDESMGEIPAEPDRVMLRPSPPAQVPKPSLAVGSTPLPLQHSLVYGLSSS